MTQYRKTVAGIEYMWGYDEPLSQYFVSAEQLNADVIEEEEDDAYIFDVWSHMCLKRHPDHPDKETWSNSELINLMTGINTNTGVEVFPEDHINAIALDLPF